MISDSNSREFKQALDKYITREPYEGEETMPEWMVTLGDLNSYQDDVEFEEIDEVQCRGQVRKILDYLNQSCPHSEPLTLTTRRECDKCMEEFQNEVMQSG
jgi:hypothetical protein